MPISRKDYLEALARMAVRIKQEMNLRKRGRSLVLTPEQQREQDADLATMATYIEERALTSTVAGSTVAPARDSPDERSGPHRRR